MLTITSTDVFALLLALACMVGLVTLACMALDRFIDGFSDNADDDETADENARLPSYLPGDEPL